MPEQTNTLIIGCKYEIRNAFGIKYNLTFTFHKNVLLSDKEISFYKFECDENTFQNIYKDNKPIDLLKQDIILIQVLSDAN